MSRKVHKGSDVLAEFQHHKGGRASGIVCKRTGDERMWCFFWDQGGSQDE